jgi:DNA polymerase III delta prime subunit
MKLFPRATTRTDREMWTIKEKFLEAVNFTTMRPFQLEYIEEILLAAEKVLAQMEREKRKK